MTTMLIKTCCFHNNLKSSLSNFNSFLKNVIQVSLLVCDFCVGGHQSEHCGTFGYGEQSQVNYMGYFHGVNLYPQANTYHPHMINNPISFNQNPLLSNHDQPLTQSFNQNSPQFTHQPYFYTNCLFNQNPPKPSI